MAGSSAPPRQVGWCGRLLALCLLAHGLAGESRPLAAQTTARNSAASTTLAQGSGAATRGKVAPSTEAPAGTATASPDSTTTADEKLTVPMLERMIKQVADDTALTAEQKATATEQYKAALESLKQSEARSAKGAEFDRLAATAADQIEETQARLKSLPKEPALNLTEPVDLEQIERQLAARRARIEHPETGLRKRVADLEAELARRGNRIKELPALISAAEAKLAELTTKQAAPAPEGEAAALTQARRIALYAQRLAAAQEIGLYKREQTWYESPDSTTLVREQQELASRELSLAEAEVGRLQTVLNRQRQTDAEERVRQAQREAALAHPLLKPVAEENGELARQDHDLTEALQLSTGELERLSARVEKTKAEFKRTQKMVEAVGLTEAIGQLLRKQRTVLQERRQKIAPAEPRADTIRAQRLRLFELDERIAALGDIPKAVDAILDELPTNAGGISREAIAAQAEVLLQRKRELLTSLHKNVTAAFENEVSLDNAERQLDEQLATYANYIDERVLWIRTSGPYTLAHLRDSPAGVMWLGQPQEWKGIGRRLLDDMRTYALFYAVAALSLIPLLVWRRRLRKELHRLGEVAAPASCREMDPTLRATAFTLVLACGWPLLLGLFGWRIRATADGSLFALAVARGLIAVASFAFPVELLRLICSRKGLGENHFQWPETLCKRITRAMRAVILVALPLVFVVASLSALENEQYLESTGRTAVLLFMLLSFYLAWRVLFTPSGSTVTVDTSETVWQRRAKGLIRFVAVGAPLGLGLLVVLGYFYTALQLGGRLHSTYWLIMGLVLVHALTVRWINVQRRRIALQQVKQMRAAAEESMQQKSPEGLIGLQHLLFPQLKIDLAAIVNQVRSLLTTTLVVVGLVAAWFVWRDVLPALGILDRWELWHTVVTENAEEKNADGTGVVKAVQRTRPVTAADLLFSLVTVALAILAGRNIPGLMEVMLLKRLQVDRSWNRAVHTLVTYAIFVTGVVVAFARLGIGWSNVQWLVAAATVGLGFGLQEIFANFVSGLILLFEQPIREGDVVTIGDTTGTVARIKFRATTIVDWDRKELVVPNKSFITGNLLNWTLSNKVNRVTIKVAVAHGGDVAKALGILTDLAKTHPSVLQDPAPSIAVTELNGSAVNFVVYLFLPTLDERMSLTTHMYTQIYSRFREAGIPFSLSSMDISVRSVPRELALAPLPGPEGETAVGPGNTAPPRIPAPAKADDPDAGE